MSNILRQQMLFEREHQRRGWFTGVFSEPPYEITPGHKHGEAHLSILHGTLRLVLDDVDRIELNAGHELDIDEGVLHSAMAGPKGVTYAFACPPEEAVRQGLVPASSPD